MGFWDYLTKTEVSFPAPLPVHVTFESRQEMDCPDAHLKLFYIETLKPHLDRIEAKLDAVIANKQSDEMKAAQGLVDVESGRLGVMREKLRDIDEIKTE